MYRVKQATLDLVKNTAGAGLGAGIMGTAIWRILADAYKRKQQETFNIASKDVDSNYDTLSIPIRPEFIGADMDTTENEKEETSRKQAAANQLTGLGPDSNPHKFSPILWPVAALAAYGGYAGGRELVDFAYNKMKPKLNSESTEVYTARQQYEDALRQLVALDDEEDFKKASSCEKYSMENFKEAMCSLHNFAIQEAEALNWFIDAAETFEKKGFVDMGAAAAPIVGGGLTLATLPFIYGAEQARARVKQQEHDATQAARAWRAQRSTRSVDASPLRAEVGVPTDKAVNSYKDDLIIEQLIDQAMAKLKQTGSAIGQAGTRAYGNIRDRFNQPAENKKPKKQESKEDED